MRMRYVPLLRWQPWIVHLDRGIRAMLLDVAAAASASLSTLAVLVEIAIPFAAPASTAAPSKGAGVATEACPLLAF